jgi:hypothetical protein
VGVAGVPGRAVGEPWSKLVQAFSYLLFYREFTPYMFSFFLSLMHLIGKKVDQLGPPWTSTSKVLKLLEKKYRTCFYCTWTSLDQPGPVPRSAAWRYTAGKNPNHIVVHDKGILVQVRSRFDCAIEGHNLSR